MVVTTAGGRGNSVGRRFEAEPLRSCVHSSSSRAGTPAARHLLHATRWMRAPPPRTRPAARPPKQRPPVAQMWPGMLTWWVRTISSTSARASAPCVAPVAALSALSRSKKEATSALNAAGSGQLCSSPAHVHRQRVGDGVGSEREDRETGGRWGEGPPALHEAGRDPVHRHLGGRRNPAAAAEMPGSPGEVPEGGGGRWEWVRRPPLQPPAFGRLSNSLPRLFPSHPPARRATGTCGQHARRKGLPARGREGGGRAVPACLPACRRT